MANSLRQNPLPETSIAISHCGQCELDIESDPQSHGRARIICPFCGEFLSRSNLPDIQQLKQDIERRARDDNIGHDLSFRSRLGRTFSRIILRRQSDTNNNGITVSQKREKNIHNTKLPPIGMDKQKEIRENIRSSSLSAITKVSSVKSIEIYDCESFQRLINNEIPQTEKIFGFLSAFYSDFVYMVKSLTLKDGKKQINWKYLEIIHNYVTNNSETISRFVLKTIASCCIRETRSECEETPIGYTIFILAPVFEGSSNNHILAHILRRVAHFVDHEHQAIVRILQTLPVDMFRSSVHRLQAFIAVNLFPSHLNASTSKILNGWWIPCAVRTLALFNHANEMISGRKIPLAEMAVDALNYIDAERDYFEWKHRMSRGTVSGFTFCQYPFVLSINAKRTILKRDSEQQMIVVARRSMIQKYQNKQTPNFNMLFLNIYVRRSHLVVDSLLELAKKHEDLKKKLRVTFVGEHGLDMGGLTKEWFLLLVRHIFQADYGMFIYHELSGVYWFNGASTDDNIREYNLVGILMGLAVYNAIILDIRFPLVCYKKLLTPAFITQQMINSSKQNIGIIQATLADFRTIRPDIAASLQYLLEYDGNVEDDFGLTFEGLIELYILFNNVEDLDIE